MNGPAQPPARYRIRIRGHVDPAWSTWFDDLTVTPADDGTTELAGALVDQAALYGLLARLRDLGATLLLVEHLTARDRPRPARDAEEPRQVGRTGEAPSWQPGPPPAARTSDS
jgi:hypothetical protein